jgi:hypothetical protein
MLTSPGSEPFEHPAVLTYSFILSGRYGLFHRPGSELSPAGCETTVKSDVSKRLFPMRVSVCLYWIAVASNMMALGILLRGFRVPLGREAQIIVVMLTAISMICWLAHFRELNR